MGVISETINDYDFLLEFNLDFHFTFTIRDAIKLFNKQSLCLGFSERLLSRTISVLHWRAKITDKVALLVQVLQYSNAAVFQIDTNHTIILLAYKNMEKMNKTLIINNSKYTSNFIGKLASSITRLKT